MTNILFVSSDDRAGWNSAEWRCAIPVRAINSLTKHRAQVLQMNDFAEWTPIGRAAIDTADIIVIQRSLMPAIFPVIDRCRSMGKIVLGDLDDGYPQLTPDNVAYEYWMHGIAKTANGPVQLPSVPVQDLPKGIAYVDGILAPSKVILKDWEGVVKNTLYAPNRPIKEWYTRTRSRPLNPAQFRMIWGGSLSHLKSFTDSGLLYALARVLPKYPHAHVSIMGADTRVFESIPVRPEQKSMLTWKDHKGWIGDLCEFDLGLIPMAGAFDARRSYIKPLEYSLMRLPWIASYTPAYDDIDTSCGIGVHNTIDHWVNEIERAILGTSRKTVDAAYRWAMSEAYTTTNTNALVEAMEKMKP